MRNLSFILSEMWRCVLAHWPRHQGRLDYGAGILSPCIIFKNCINNRELVRSNQATWPTWLGRCAFWPLSDFYMLWLSAASRSDKARRIRGFQRILCGMKHAPDAWVAWCPRFLLFFWSQHADSSSLILAPLPIVASSIVDGNPFGSPCSSVSYTRNEARMELFWLPDCFWSYSSGKR